MLRRGESALFIGEIDPIGRVPVPEGWRLGNNSTNIKTKDRPCRLEAVGEQRDTPFEGEKKPDLVRPGRAKTRDARQCSAQARHRQAVVGRTLGNVLTRRPGKGGARAIGGAVEVGKKESEGPLVGQARGRAGTKRPGFGKALTREQDGSSRIEHQRGSFWKKVRGQIEDGLGVEKNLVRAAGTERDARKGGRLARTRAQDEPVVGIHAEGCPEGVQLLRYLRKHHR